LPFSRHLARLKMQILANLTPLWPSPPKPTTSTFLPLVTSQRRMGE
jgi:hypothetical protein